MKLPEIPANVFSEAVREFWKIRERQAQKQQKEGKRDQGSRGAVTGGKQMEPFARVIIQFLEEVGVRRSDIYYGNFPTDLPGFYRPTKRWDIIVVSSKNLLAAIELKSQVGSFGNNFNNRTEEALGSAEDIWTAYREGAFLTSPAPWLGYLFLLEDCEKSREPVRVNEPHFPVFEEFRGASYAKRYELFCRKLVRERKYSAACFLLTDSSKADSENNYTEPAEDLNARQFLIQLLRHVLFM